jgi:lipid II:glycine glycyltransferase (peptidoglycan interpeptide bridge formation enzyme)
MEEWGRVVATLPDHHVFQTPAWLEFLAESQRATPVIAVVKERQEPVGYFVGLIARKFGAKILGSPFPGWMTDYMGFQLCDGVSRRQAARALVEYAFDHLKCVHLEFRDRHFRPEDVDGLGFVVRPEHGYEIDLSPPEQELFARTTKNCRWSIRKAQREGVTIEEAEDEAFADDFYAQLHDVFAKRRLVPSYDKNRVRQLIRHLLPTGMLHLLRARDAEGHCVATWISLGTNKHVFGWGAASWRQYQKLQPNELIFWHVLRYWKARGLQICDLGGGAHFFKRFGCHDICVPRFAKSRLPLVPQARDAARTLVRVRQRLLGRIRA